MAYRRQETMPLSTHVSTASGQRRLLAEGSRLVFGRGPDVDLIVAAGRGLSRRAGVVTVLAAGAWIANISRTHALYVEGDGYQVRLPRMEDDGEPANGWFVRTGRALVGSRAMLDEGQSLVVTVTLQSGEAVVPRGAGRADGTALAGAEPTGAELAAAELTGAELAAAGLAGTGLAAKGLPAKGLPAKGLAAKGLAAKGLADEVERTDAVVRVSGGGQTEPEDAELAGAGTLLPFYLDPMTKLFLVALIWCRPWLVDPSATRPLPRTPEIARGALEVTGAYHELERFNADPEYRDLLAARVAEHIKVLRRKIADRGLAAADVRLSDEVAVRILIEHGIITSADLSRLDDPAWRSRQEDLWWTQS
jgi:hypothetical protein